MSFRIGLVKQQHFLSEIVTSIVITGSHCDFDRYRLMDSYGSSTKGLNQPESGGNHLQELGNS